MGQKGPIIVQKGLNMHEKRHIIEFWTQKNCFLAEFSLAEFGVPPSPPLTDNHPAQKPLAERGGTPFPP